MRLEAEDPTRCFVPYSGSVRALLLMGIESARQSLKLLEALQEQGLLGKHAQSLHESFALTINTESFLPFDLDAAFASTVLLLMAAAADNSLAQQEDNYWTIAETVLEEIESRGNLIARHMRAELNQLNNIFGQLPPSRPPRAKTSSIKRKRRQEQARSDSSISNQMERVTSYPAYEFPMSMDQCDWQHGFTSENLTLFAEALNPDDLDWLSSTMLDVPYITEHSEPT